MDVDSVTVADVDDIDVNDGDDVADVNEDCVVVVANVDEVRVALEEDMTAGINPMSFIAATTGLHTYN